MAEEKKKMSLPAKMGIGFAAGILLGFIFQMGGWDIAWVKPFGDIFIRLIRMIVVPLVFISLVAGAASMGDLSKLGRVSVKTIIYYVGTTAIAVFIGLIIANVFQPGAGLTLSLEGLKAREVTPPGTLETFLNIVPLNPVQALAEGKLLQIIFFAIFFGFALSSLGETGKPLLKIFEVGNEVMIRITAAVMHYAPYGVCALIAYTVGNSGIEVLLPLMKLIVLMYVAALIHVCVVYLPLLKGAGKFPLVTFFKVMSQPLLIAFSTCSSAAALPANMAATEKLGVPRQISSFTIPLGTTINMDGAAIYLGLAAVFVAQIYGIELSFASQLSILLIAILASIGSVGVPSAALVVMTMVFTQVQLPMEGIALVAGVDRILDMARTTLNVMGDATGAVVVSRLEGDLDLEPVGDGSIG
ncbi:dicarboxylate/amino acid:cation symporter [Desulfobotulus sp. H1]|uniref:Dicarboxylate/amino acid:cation symporter n=1 Tax=Desulfobotulus pelophilus TaxID=2823377 RepID=A0ABT3N730_9BACT|nr:dicarboxylate/amino acid:cation symporter [Desulfobotulus pelophilus]MCW7753260.1 dicarboxylate/amino acid:cation symporter [Desulfobotulus pelophilus]